LVPGTGDGHIPALPQRSYLGDTSGYLHFHGHECMDGKVRRMCKHCLLRFVWSVLYMSIVHIKALELCRSVSYELHSIFAGALGLRRSL
jgi:hypothetical protein